MISTVRALGLCCILTSVAAGCSTAAVAPGKAAVPPPPQFTADFRKALGAEIAQCPASETIVAFVIESDGYADRLERLIAPERGR